MNTHMYPSIASNLRGMGLDVIEILDIFDVGTFSQDDGEIVEHMGTAVKYLTSDKKIRYYRHEGPVTSLLSDD